MSQADCTHLACKMLSMAESAAGACCNEPGSLLASRFCTCRYQRRGPPVAPIWVPSRAVPGEGRVQAAKPPAAALCCSCNCQGLLCHDCLYRHLPDACVHVIHTVTKLLSMAAKICCTGCKLAFTSAAVMLHLRQPSMAWASPI